MSGPPILISAGGAPTANGRTPTRSHPRDAAASDSLVDGSQSEWFKRSRYYAEQAVANAERNERQKVEKRLDKASRGWTTREVARTYRANSDGHRRFGEEADVLTQHEYVGWLQMGRAGGSLSGRLLLGTRLASFARRGRRQRSPNMSVTWLRQRSNAEEVMS